MEREAALCAGRAFGLWPGATLSTIPGHIGAHPRWARLGAEGLETHCMVAGLFASMIRCAWRQTGTPCNTALHGTGKRRLEGAG
eukprot:5289644-Amphidinium_carterae.2